MICLTWKVAAETQKRPAITGDRVPAIAASSLSGAPAVTRYAMVGARGASAVVDPRVSSPKGIAP
jgi:hypothetical protein